MKGKSKVFYKISILLVALVTAIVFVGLANRENPEKIYAAQTIAGENFSSVDANNLILSAEKVAVISTTDDDTQDVFKTPLYLDNTGMDTSSTMLTRGNEKYYYMDIPSGENDKYVISNGEFVMLNNDEMLSDGKTYYYNNLYSAYVQSGTGAGYTAQNMAEAVMLSFGQYVYNSEENEIVKADEDSGANIQYINIIGYKNGEEIANLPGVRQYDNNTYQDFVYIIPQSTGNEGFYQFNITYRYNDTTYNQTFEFYILYESSYSRDISFGGTYTYSSSPTLNLYDSQFNSENGVYRYYLGKSSKNYPTLVYDYTKFKMQYTITANGKVTTYDYDYVTNTTLGGVSANLVLTITDSNGTRYETYSLSNYNAQSENNIAVVVLTEMGNYDFSFEYLYAGYNSGSAPNMNLTISNQYLVISGFELKYSKADYNEAQMRYLTISKNSKDLVDLIVPNGYEKDNEPSISNLGVVYSLDTESRNKVGTVESYQDANLNQEINSATDTVGRILAENVTQDAGVYKLNVNADAVAQLFDGVDSEDNAEIVYQKTNQGSLWLATNDTYTINESFYYFSKSKFTTTILNDDTKNGYATYSNQTSFSSTGYYLVFIKVDVNGLTSDQAQNIDYYQVFAFQYSTDTINVNVYEYENGASGKAIGSGGYTNKNVQVSWTEPDIFERAINARYYSVTNQFYDKDRLLTTTPYQLTNGQVLGANIANRQGASFLIELNSEGRAASYRTFTIDRQPITGVAVYSVVATTSASDGSAVYEFRTNVNGDYVRISNSITDSLATIFWNDKASGAGITLTYTFTPFVRDSSITPDEIFSSFSEIWHSTNYRLGTTVGSFDDIYKADSMGSEIPASSVLRNQGIYVFTLTDAAGNSCKYLFVIDNTESFFEVNGSMMTQTSVLYGDDVTINVGTHKAVQLFENNSDLDSELYSLIRASSVSEYEDLGYYVESDTNINALNNLFSILNSANTYYLKVQNSSLTVYTNQGIQDASLAIPSISASNHTRVMTYQVSASTSTIRTFYLLGVNQANVEPRDSKSFVTIEINKDNSRGSVYYSQDSFTINDLNNSNVFKLDTGSDNIDPVTGEEYNGLEGAFATSDNYIAFVWTQGTGLYEVASVSYQRYELNLSESSFDENKFYFYASVDLPEVILYNSDGAQNDARYDVDTDRYFALLNVTDGQSGQGLYVVTRRYQGDGSDDFGDDKYEQNYYFIVDRNEIIDVTNVLNGGYITIGLLEKETEYNSFSQIGTQTGRLDYIEGGIVNSIYNLYLTTDKLPATLNVPVGKYFGGTYGSTYYAGRLVFDVYFKDTQNQLDGANRGKTIKLFDIDEEESANVDNYIDGYYKIDIDAYLSEISTSLRNRFIRSDNEDNWLCLNGDYIVVINDLVQGSAGSHQKIIGFRLHNSEPTTDVYSVPQKDNTVSNAIYEAEKQSDRVYSLTTSEEFVKIDLNEYVEDSTSAGVDVNYLVVNRTLNGVTTEYINYRYSNTGGEYNLDNNSDVVQNIRDEAGNLSRVITLNTYLRDESGNIDLDSLNQTLSYDIYIRYKLSSDSNNERYKNCYYYYDAEGNLIEYYETHYTVIIDRTPPENNIKYLLENDTLVDYYVEEMGVDMFESAVYEDNSGVYFVNQYTAYYQEKDASKIYAFKVDNQTAFDKEDISTVYYRVLEGGLGTANLNLPVTNYASYTSVTNLSTVTSYSSLFNNSQFGQYIEILEQDSAGNVTQYVIFYSADGDYDALDMKFEVTRVNEGAIVDEDVTFSLATDSLNNSLTIFDIALPGDEVFNDVTDKFYRIELVSMLGDSYYINTNGSTQFENSGLGQAIVDMIKTAGQGNYILTLYSRTNTYSTTLNYYDINERIELNILNLVEELNGEYRINLLGANVTYNGITYYAEEIIIRHNGESQTYICRPENGRYNYYIYSEINDSYTLVSNIILLEGGTYQIEMTDAFGQTSYHRFNTEGQDFYSLEFAGGNSYELSNVYYSFNQATISYNPEVYSNVNIIYSISGINNQTVATDASSVSFSGIEIINIDRTNGEINIIPYFGSNYLGENLRVTVQLIFNNEVEFVYNVVIDTRTGAVNLRDTNNASQGMEVDINTNFEDTAYSTTGSGTMNLTWNKTENEYFNYVYLLHEEMLTGEYVTENLSEFTSWVINTGDDSTGSYKFEVQIYTKDGLYLGNKVYSFSVQAVLNQLYYVQTGNNEAVGQNSSFTFAELQGMQNISIPAILRALGLTSADQLPSTTIPLYISNKTLFVVVSTDQGASQASYSISFGEYEFEIYRVYTNTYSLYLGTLKVPETDNVVSGIMVNTNELAVNTSLSYTYSGTQSDSFVLSFNQVIPTDNLLTKKNTILLDVYYDDEFVKTVDTKNLGGGVSFTIQGNGKYSFVFRDLAQNTHTFSTTTGLVQNAIDILILREVVITINGGAPIDNAYYNGSVDLSVYNPSMYNLGSIQLYATRNGSSYEPDKSQYNYTFDDYGTFRVTVSATYGEADSLVELRKVIVFTIVNENEAREAIDLTSLAGYSISKVLNNLGADITTNFLEIMNINSGMDGMLLTYDKMIENSSKLGISSGKQMFTITYLISDGIYPNREVTFSFTINNEIPNIECSLDYGESTTKGFTIQYNPGIIYDQVGDSLLYINNVLVIAIDENSPTQLMETERTEEIHGEGDYYIRLVSSSGNVILSYKVEIKQPLNAWAIVIIVVVSVLVITVVTVIIVLRTRMRIR